MLIRTTHPCQHIWLLFLCNHPPAPIPLPPSSLFKSLLAWYFLHCFRSKLIRAVFIFFSLSFPVSMQFHRACLVLWYSVLCCCHASLWPSWRFLTCRDYWRRITEIPIIHTNVLQKERKFTEIFYGHLFTLVNSEQAMVLICQS